MKMRKKLAALLAAAMIASVMPMTAFAASTNRVTHVVKVANDGSTTDPEIKIELKDDLAKGKKFYLNLENAQWQDQDALDLATSAAIKLGADLANGDSGYTVKRISNTELEITTSENSFSVGDEFVIKLATKAIKGDASVTVVPWDAPLTESKHLFATSSERKITASVADAPAFYTGRNLKLAKITLEETVIASLSSAKVGDKIEITLDNDDYEFVRGTLKQGKGFTGTQVANGLKSYVALKDPQRFIIEINSKSALVAAQRGTVEVDLVVDSVAKKPAVGDLTVEIGGDLADSQDLKVATIAEYGVSLKADKEYEFLAGRQTDVVFHLNEIVDDSMVNGSGRVTEFSLPEGVYFKKGSVDLKTGTKVGNIDYIENDDKQVTGFTVELNATSKLDKFKFEAKLDITSNFAGDVVLTAEGRSIGSDVEAVLATVTPAVKVTIEPMTVKVGLKEQIGGKVVLEELEKGALLQGGEIVVSLEKESGVYVTGVDVDVTKGDLRKGDIDVSKTTEGSITIKVRRRSREASTIELTNLKVKLDRTVPEGSYSIEVGGTAVSELATVGAKDIYGYDYITTEDFLFVGEKYTRPVVVFTIGSEKFTVNGEEILMDAEAYLKDGRTMVPLRYLSYALGVDAESIKFNAGIVTIFKNDGTILQVKNGSKDLVVNGMSVPMVTSATIVEGRTYVPITEIGYVFGVQGTWDAATQTATFQ